MSSPANIVSSFRSYSYYHILSICDTSATADTLAQMTNTDTWLHPISDIDPKLGKYTPKTINLLDANGNKTNTMGKYVILINGATDADFSIDSIRWTALNAGAATMNDKNTSIATEGHMEISEPRGVAFLDFLVNACLSLGISAEQATCVIKTYIVGATDDSDNTISYINDIAPLQVLLIDAKAKFTPQGGVYSMDFVSIANGAARLPQYSKVPDSVQVNLSDLKNPSLSDAMARLQTRINEMYDKHYRCVVATVSHSQDTTQQKMASAMRPMKVVIKLDEEYSKSTYVVTDQPVQLKENGQGCEGISYSSRPASSVEDMIHEIMGKCPQIRAEEGIGETSSGQAVQYMPKIHSAVYTSYSSNGTGVNYEIRYEIIRTISPKTSALENLLPSTSESTNSTATNLDTANALKENSIEFDYIYSGKNIDIIDFDLNANLGLSYLQVATMSNTLKDATEKVPAKGTTVLNAKQQSTRFNQIKAIPVAPGSTMQSVGLTDTQNPATNVRGEYTLSTHAALEMLEANVTIIGNPALMSSINKTSSGSPNRVNDAVAKARSASGYATVDQADFPHWNTIPAFVKINVFMPTTNDDMQFFETASNGKAYTKKFWYDGYYYVLGVDIIFSEGQFTQQLHLIALPSKAAMDVTNQSQNTSQKMDNRVMDCYSSELITDYTAQQDKTDGSTAGTIKKSADDNVTSDTRINSGAPADVLYWDKASTEVQNAIISAAGRYGVSARTLAIFASRESGFDPRAQAAGSSAAGLFQFITDTWLGLANQKTVDQLKTYPTFWIRTSSGAANPDQNDANKWAQRAACLAYRFDPVVASMAAARSLQIYQQTLGTSEPYALYLAHFQGPGTAKKILAAASGTSLSTVLGEAAYQKMLAANKGLKLHTVDDAIAWCKSAINTRLKNLSAVQKQVVATTSTNTSAGERTAGGNIAAVSKPLTAEEKAKAAATPCSSKVPPAPIKQ